MADDVLKQAMSLIIAGNKKSASELLASLVRSDPKNEMAWLYLSYCVEFSDQKEYCLKKTLEINPNNQQAKQALSEMKIGNQASNISNVSPKPLTQTQTNQQKNSPRPASKKSNNLVPVLVAGSVLVVALAVLLVVVFWGLSKIGVSGLSLPINIATSPAKSYSDQMVPILTQYNAYTATLNQWKAVLSENSTTGFLVGAWAEMSPQLLAYSLNQPSYSQPIAQITTSAKKVSSDGFALLTAWNSVTPPAAVKLPHEQVAACIQFNIDTANQIIAMITKAIPPSGNVSTNPCDNAQDALSAIQTYVNNNR